MFFVIRPELANISGTQGEIAQSRKELRSLGDQVASFQQASSELKKVADGRKEIANLFPNRTDLEGVVIGLEDAAASSGIQMSIKITDALETPLYQNTDKPKAPTVAGLTSVEEVPFTMQVAGTYAQLTDFFLFLDNAPYLTKITSLSVVGDKNEGQQKDVEPKNNGLASGQATGMFFMRSGK